MREPGKLQGKRLSKSRRTRRKSKIIVASLLFAFFAFVAGLLLWPTYSESLVVSRSVSIQGRSEVADAFTYSAQGISADMATGCNIPAAFKLEVTQMRSRGKIRIYINDFYVGYADITSTGKASITSGCGCSTSCICTIRTGQNTVRLVSDGFSGEMKYEVYVKK